MPTRAIRLDGHDTIVASSNNDTVAISTHFKGSGHVVDMTPEQWVQVKQAVDFLFADARITAVVETAPPLDDKEWPKDAAAALKRLVDELGKILEKDAAEERPVKDGHVAFGVSMPKGLPAVVLSARTEGQPILEWEVDQEKWEEIAKLVADHFAKVTSGS